MTVKAHQEKFQTVAKTAGINHEELLANADSWVAGFLEKFEKHCHNMETAIKGRIQEKLGRQASKGIIASLTQQTRCGGLIVTLDELGGAAVSQDAEDGVECLYISSSSSPWWWWWVSDACTSKRFGSRRIQVPTLRCVRKNCDTSCPVYGTRFITQFACQFMRFWLRFCSANQPM